MKRVLDALQLVYEDRTTPIPYDAQACTMLISPYGETENSPVLFGIIGGTFKNVYNNNKGMSFCNGANNDWSWLIQDVSVTPSISGGSTSTSTAHTRFCTVLLVTVPHFCAPLYGNSVVKNAPGHFCGIFLRRVCPPSVKKELGFRARWCLLLVLTFGAYLLLVLTFGAYFLY